jgi:hypothetical protein
MFRHSRDSRTNGKVVLLKLSQSWVGHSSIQGNETAEQNCDGHAPAEASVV